MIWNASPIPPVRGRLARYLGQLRHNLDAVGEQMRESVANAVGRTVAEVVGEAVYDALLPRAPASSPLSHSAHHSAEASLLHRRDGAEPGWERQTEDALWHDSYTDDDVDEEAPSAYREPGRDVPTTQHERRSRRWHEALAVGVEAVSWWLRRQRGPVSLLAALTIGTLAGLTVLVGPVGKAVDVVASALGLAYLLDLIRSASNLLAASLSSTGSRA